MDYDKDPGRILGMQPSGLDLARCPICRHILVGMMFRSGPGFLCACTEHLNVPVRNVKPEPVTAFHENGSPRSKRRSKKSVEED